MSFFWAFMTHTTTASYASSHPSSFGAGGQAATIDTGIGNWAFKDSPDSGNVNSSDSGIIQGDESYNVLLRPCFLSTTGASVLPVTVTNIWHWWFENSAGQNNASSPAAGRIRTDGHYEWDTNSMYVLVFTRKGSMSYSNLVTIKVSPTGSPSTWGSGGRSFASFNTSTPANAWAGWSTTNAVVTNGGSSVYNYGDWILFRLGVDGSYTIGPGGESVFMIQYDITE